MSFFYYEQSVDLTANGTVELSFPGARSLQILDLSGSVEMQVDQTERTPIRKGTGFEDQDFERVRLTEKAGSTASITLAISGGRVKDSRFSATAGIATNSGDSIETPASVTTVTGNAEGPIAASTARNGIIIQNQSATENLWVGDSNVGNDAVPRGLKVSPGGTVSLDTGGAIYYRRGAATNVALTWMNLND